MKKIFFTFCLLTFLTQASFAENLNSDIYLFCNNTGADKYKYEFLMIQELLVNDLQLTKEQRKDLENIFNRYIDDYSVLANNLEENNEIYKKMKSDKTSLTKKLEQKHKIKDAKKDINRLQNKITKETKNILTTKQKSKYKTVLKSVFK